MKVFLLGLDGATWDLLKPLASRGLLPNLSRLMGQGVSGTLRSVFPPLSPVAWTGVMTGKNSAKHGIFEFLEYAQNPLLPRVNSSKNIKADLVWEIAGRHGKRTVAGGVPMSYPPRPAPGFFLGDFLSPANALDFASDAQIFAELERAVGPYQPWSTTVHDNGNEANTLKDLRAFLQHHLDAVKFLMKRCEWDLFMFDLMAIDRIQHELWHVWDDKHTARRGREAELDALKPGCDEFWSAVDRGVGEIEASLPEDASLILMSDHGFGPIEKYVNFNVWLLERGDIALQDSLYVKQKHWCYQRGVTPEWVYGLMAKLGLAGQRVSRFRGKQTAFLERFGESAFLSRKHIDWSRTKAYSQGNFGQIFLNLKGRQPQGCVEPADALALLDELKSALMAMPNPETGEPLVEHVYEAAEIYEGPYLGLAPDLTVVLKDWKYRTIGLHDFTTNRVISPAFGPTGDHRMEGIFIGKGPAFAQGGRLDESANLLDIAPTLLQILGVPVPNDMDGKVLHEVLDHSRIPASTQFERDSLPVTPAEPVGVAYTEEEDAEIQQRLADLGYL